MSLKIQASFSSGELDPALRERTTLEKYRSGLDTARSVVVGKTGRLLSRSGRKHLIEAKLADRKVKIHTSSSSGMFIEWGHLYFRVYEMDGTLVGELAHGATEDLLPLIQFVDVGFDLVMVLINGVDMETIKLSTFSFVGAFGPPGNPTIVALSVLTTGYLIEYAITFVIGGQESAPLITSLNTPRDAVAYGEANVVTARVIGGASGPTVSEMRVYSRPLNAGAFGFVGSSTSVYTVGVDIEGVFYDSGGDVDFGHSLPTPSPGLSKHTITDPRLLGSRTGTVYQQRLILSDGDLLEASRTGFQNNFYRDYPYSDDSAISLSAGARDFADIYYLIEHDGLIAFTSQGVFVHTGALTPTNLSLDKKGNWTIDVDVPPISVPGGVLFIDATTNTVRELRFSDEFRSYLGVEISIFSDHLFDKKVVSWAFQDGEIPLLWVSFSDGTLASLTYERDHKMRAWTRHDSEFPVEGVASSIAATDPNATVAPFTFPSEVLFITNKNGVRYIEKIVPRILSPEAILLDSEADMQNSIAAMDSMVSWSSLLNDNLTDDDITLAPLTPGVWDGPLTLSVVDDAIFPDPGAGAVGTILRHFHPIDKTITDLEVTARASDDSVTVQPSAEFPSTYATNPRLYETQVTFTSLDHLDDESVSVIVDGSVVSSPNNDIQNYPISTVVAGSLTLPNSLIGAIVHIGRPYTMDVKTLSIDTVEQRPVLIESVTTNKVYVKVDNSRGLYVGSNFPDDDKVNGMDEIDSYLVDYSEDDEIIGNRYDQPKNHRYEVTVEGDWKGHGTVCIRQVDPLHFEILSIIPDLTDMKRGR